MYLGHFSWFNNLHPSGKPNPTQSRSRGSKMIWTFMTLLSLDTPWFASNPKTSHLKREIAPHQFVTRSIPATGFLIRSLWKCTLPNTRDSCPAILVENSTRTMTPYMNPSRLSSHNFDALRNTVLRIPTKQPPQAPASANPQFSNEHSCKVLTAGCATIWPEDADEPVGPGPESVGKGESP